MLLYDATHTSHTRAQTGIQRVCRSLFAELEKKSRVTAVCHDPFYGGWRPLRGAENANLRDRPSPPGKSRGSRWTLGQKISGRLERAFGKNIPLPTATGLICPELLLPRVGQHLPPLFTHVAGPRIALFHDAIGLQFPELTPPATVARLPAYLRELLQFDGIAAVSEDSAQTLRDFWSWLGVSDAPPVLALPLGLDPLPLASSTLPQNHTPPHLLSVGTIEGRKNHLALLEAAEALWSAGFAFELELIGLPRPDTAAAALRKISALQDAGYPVQFRGSVSEAELHAAYARCTFTIYPSLIEGFGLPVLESLQHGKPCLCSAQGALGEAARGGGCLALAQLDAANLTAALRDLLAHPEKIARLGEAARQRTIRSWETYTDELLAWMATLPVRAARPGFAVA